MKDKENWIAINKADHTIYKRNVYRTELLMINTIFSQEYKQDWITEREKITGQYKAGAATQAEKRALVLRDYVLIKLTPAAMITNIQEEINLNVKGV